jgi:phosphoserine phosphatase RsbU/P
VGKGIQASILMSHIMALFSEYKKESAPDEILKAVNRKLMETIYAPVNAILATVFYASYLPESNTLKYASAGHPFPILCRGGLAAREALSGVGMPFGLFHEIEITHNEIIMYPGDKLFLFTDGVSEANCADGEYYGQEQLFRALEQSSDQSSAETLDYIKNDIHRLLSPGTEADDMALMCMKFL